MIHTFSPWLHLVKDECDEQGGDVKKKQYDSYHSLYLTTLSNSNHVMHNGFGLSCKCNSFMITHPLDSHWEQVPGLPANPIIVKKYPFIDVSLKCSSKTEISWVCTDFAAEVMKLLITWSQCRIGKPIHWGDDSPRRASSNCCFSKRIESCDWRHCVAHIHPINAIPPSPWALLELDCTNLRWSPNQCLQRHWVNMVILKRETAWAI